MPSDQRLPESPSLEGERPREPSRTGGDGDVRALRWLDPPSEALLGHAEALLEDLGAIESGGGRVTPLGLELLEFPVHPRFGRMLIEARRRGCVGSAATVAALTQERSLLVRRAGDEVREQRDLKLPDEEDSDFFHLMGALDYARRGGFDLDTCRRLGIHAVAARRVAESAAFFERVAGAVPGEERREDLQKCIVAAFADQLACRADDGSLRCAMVHGRSGSQERESVVRRSPLFVASDVRELERGGGRVEVVLSLCTAVRREWLDELFPGEVREQTETAYDAAAKRVTARRSVMFRGLAIESRLGGTPDPGRAASLLAGEVLAGRLALKHWDHAAEQWIFRVNLLAKHCPELGIGAIDDESRRLLVEEICGGATSYKDIKDRPVLPALRDWVPGHLRHLVEKHAPERIELSNGRTPKVQYDATGAATLSARIQELYGVSGEVRVAQGRVPVVIHVLAPNHRPVQITRDLERFWREDYPKVKRELQRKYPKHEWR